MALIDPLLQLRGALLTTSNTGGVSPSDAVEIDAKIDKIINDSLFKSNPLRAIIPRKPMNGQLSFIWNIRTAWGDGSSNKAIFYSEAGDGTAYPSKKIQLYATATSLRSDWEVSRLFLAGSASYYNAKSDEIYAAAQDLAEKEEKQIIGGTDTGAYGHASGFLGLKQLLNSYVTLSDTTTIYGIARASGKTYMDCQLVNASSAALKLSHLDSAITAVRKAGGEAGFLLMSFDREDELNRLLQPQQRFLGTMELEGGFTIATYKRIPIIASKYMDKAGSSDTDTAIFLIGKDNVEMRVLSEAQNFTMGITRNDTEGGYITLHEVLVSRVLNFNCLIYGLATPA